MGIIFKAARQQSRGAVYLPHAIIAVLFLVNFPLFSQELEPRNLTNVPVGTNFAVLGYGYAQGNILFDPALPLEDVNARTHALVGAWVRSYNFFGMGAKTSIILPFAAGDWEGIYQGDNAYTSRTGIADVRLGFAFNFIGSPAVDKSEFKEYKQKTIAGFSFQMVAPTGQYFEDRLINLGSNRWAFRPQLDVSHKIGTWYLEYALNAWLYTSNEAFWGGKTLQQKPLGTIKLNVIKSFNKGIWASIGAGYAFGGRSFVNTVKRDANISTMRMGAILTIPVHPQHSLKLTAVVARRFEEGADFDSFGLAYQFMWNGKN
jgi:hypothetical protein